MQPSITVRSPPPPLLLLLLLLLPSCLCIAPHFQEELSQLPHELLPSCTSHNPPLRTWSFPFAARIAGGMVWVDHMHMLPQPHSIPQRPLRHHLAEGDKQQRHTLAISDPASDSSIAVTSSQLAHGLAVLQVAASVRVWVLECHHTTLLCRSQLYCPLLLLLCKAG